MKKLLILTVMVFITAISFALEVMTYNVWNGFERDGGKESKAAFIEFMNESNVDVAALQELNGFNNFKLRKLAKQYGHKNAVILKSFGYPVGITSKEPIKVIKKQLTGFWHGFLHVKTAGVHFVVIHLSPSSSEYRLDEMQKLVAYITDNQLMQEKLIVLGDYNSYVAADSEIYASRPAVISRESNDNKVDNGLDYRVIEGFEKAGLVDIQTKVNPAGASAWTFPGFELRKAHEGIERGVRIDYQLANPAMAEKAVKCETVHNALTHKISDHYPVVATYEE